MIPHSPSPSSPWPPLGAALFALASLLSLGCGTTMTGTATEQLLISDAVDQAIGQIDFHAIAGKKVYVETEYFSTLKGANFISSHYITSSIRQQLTAARCRLQDKREDAEIIVEPRVGALGTDGHEVIYGIPSNSAISTAASAFSSGTPMPSIPEISVGKVNSKTGIAKIIVYAYDRETREPIWQSGIARAESTSRDTWMFGAGPFQKGSIHNGSTKFAGKRLQPPQFEKIVFDPPFKHALHDLGRTKEEAPILESPDPQDVLRPIPIPVENEFIFVNDPQSPEPDLDSEGPAVQPANHEEAAEGQ